MVNSVKNTLDIDVTTNPVPTFQEFRNDVTGRKMTGAFRTGWQPDYPSPENYLYQLYSSDAADGNGSNDGDYKNSEFDDLCSKAAAAQTTDEANKLYQQAQEILLNDLPAIPLYYSNANGVAASGVKNFVMTGRTFRCITRFRRADLFFGYIVRHDGGKRIVSPSCRQGRCAFFGLHGKVVRQLSKNSALSPNRDASVSRSARFRLWDDNPDVISNRRMII